MQVRWKPWLALSALAVVIAALVFSIDYYPHRFVRSAADMVALLPAGDATIFFADVSTLRRAGLLSLLSGSRTAEDKDYRQFVSVTGFDYTRDLDAIAGAYLPDGTYFVIDGHWDWGRLRQYAVTHGGSCESGVCGLPTSQGGRWISFLTVQPNVIGLAVSGNHAAALALLPHQQPRRALPPYPVWVRIAESLMKNPSSLPLGLRIFAITLQPANSVVLGAGPGGSSDGTAFQLQLDALCPNAAVADTVRNQLEIQTKMLKLELAREHQQPSPADLTGLLTSGTFQVIGDRVIGQWPVSTALLKALQ